MANHKSAKKRARQTIVRNARNTIRRSSVKNAVKKVRLAIEEGNKENASSLLVAAQKQLAKLAKHGVIKRNSAARRTSRLASQVNNI
ncbi:30S ribosomal protein S20 [Bacteriovorax sp. DB6_IX]|uniref:30S ribosomal protein S20 n=1 Tax=Bacteriovorax sp. DB6_IX TaxID=1353530 RepID=UPI000389F93A|nr:30S ribosomal protein S20 [Bacteriovorax sp. DB6_IX]EQC51459.1 ribosomal protein S20 [Bacteriovorax sp. DB6_IX]